jgi:hypothetical protein
MTQESFDPYRKWLGIPPRDQPPNYYRLLGIEIFESDPDVISNAADGRMGQIRTFQTGRHSEWSQRLLNEVATARVCLLNEAKKAAYDESLRHQFGARNGPPVVICRGAIPPVALPEIASGPSGVPRVVPSASGSRPRNRQRVPIVMAVVAAAVVMTGSAVLLLRSGGESDVDTSPGLKPDTEVVIQDNTVVDGTATQPAEISSDGEGPPENNERMDGGESGRTMDLAPDTGVSEPVVADVEGMEEGTAGDVEVGMSNQPPPDNRMTSDLVPDSPSPEPVPSAVTPPTEPDRRGLGDLMKPPSRSVPPESDQEDARRRIREIFRDDFSSSYTPADKVALAVKLRGQGLGTENDPVARFVFLKMAADLAASAPHHLEAFKAIDAIKEHYDADVLTMKADVLTGVVKVIRGGQAGALLAQAAALLAEEAVARDDYKMADRLLNLGERAARKANHKIIANELMAREREVTRTDREYAPVEKALAVLANNPLDAKANGKVGRWHCYEKNDWAEGLTYLAKGENTPLRELAKRDLATLGNLIAPDQQRELGDGWWELSGSARGVTKAAYMCRAVYWYQKALIGITGLEKAAAEKRIETAARDEDVMKSRTWGAVEEGNVALASNGTTVEGVERDGNRLLDGRVTVASNARGKCPCQWVITFAKPYRLKEIRFKLSNIEPHVFRYAIGTSPDGKELVPLADRSQGNWSSWQQFRFSSRLVKSVKIFGLYGSIDGNLVVGEFEAYCIPPQTSPDTASR